MDRYQHVNTLKIVGIVALLVGLTRIAIGGAMFGQLWAIPYTFFVYFLVLLSSWKYLVVSCILFASSLWLRRHQLTVYYVLGSLILSFVAPFLLIVCLAFLKVMVIW